MVSLCVILFIISTYFNITFFQHCSQHFNIFQHISTDFEFIHVSFSRVAVAFKLILDTGVRTRERQVIKGVDLRFVQIDMSMYIFVQFCTVD